MSTTWYAKIDCNFHANRKAIKAGRLGRELYLFILCVNAQKGAIGLISSDDLEPWYVARQLQMTEDEAHQGIALCVNAGLIEIADGLVTICGWTDDYSKYPLTPAEKQKQYRQRAKERKPTNQNVTGVTDALPTGSNALPPVTQVGREEGRDLYIAPVTQSPTAEPYIEAARRRGLLAESVWSRLSRTRSEIAAELGLQDVLALPTITPGSEPKAFRDLRDRIREEGDGAEGVCERVICVLAAQARKDRTIEWLSGKAFGENAWRHNRDAVSARQNKASIEQPAPVFIVGGVEVRR